METSKNLINNTNFENISEKDGIFILMCANKEKPITGRLVFVKEIFLLAKEIIPQLDSKYQFFPADFGPYSTIFANTVDELLNKKLIKVEYMVNSFGEPLHRFSLTNNGIIEASKSFDKLSNQLKNTIIMKRRWWDHLGYTGIVRLVYSKYPNYTIYSKIKGKIKNAD